MAITLQIKIFIYSFASKLECRFQQSLPYWLAAFLAVSKASFGVSGYFCSTTSNTGRKIWSFFAHQNLGFWAFRSRTDPSFNSCYLRLFCNNDSYGEADI